MENRLKIVIVGDGGCGKTVLLFAYSTGAFEDSHIPTVMDSYLAEIQINDRVVALEINDTAGQEDFEQIRTLIYPGTDVFMMCYSCVNPSSLSNINKFWYPETVDSEPDVPFILVGNKVDLKNSTDPQHEYVKEARGDQLLARLGGKAHIQCSARDEAQGKPTGKVKQVFKAAIKAGLEGQMMKNGEMEQPKRRWKCNLL